MRSIRIYLDLNFEHAEYKIYAYIKSFFYTSLGAGRLEILPIRKGQNVKVNLALQQLENLPVTGVFVYTVPDSTQDCENDPNYDLDQAYTKLFHAEFNKEFGCTLPIFGGLKISSEEGHMLCLNASIYNNT